MATTMQQPRPTGAPALTVLLVSACAAALFLTMALHAPSADMRTISWAGLGLFSCFVMATLPRLFHKKSKALKQVYSGESKGAAAVLSDDEIADRLPIWEAVAELWLDVEMKQGEIKFIAQRLAQSKYSMERNSSLNRIWNFVNPLNRYGFHLTEDVLHIGSRLQDSKW